MLASALAMVASTASPPAEAEGLEVEGLEVEVRWQSPRGCPTQAEVVADIERLAGAPVVASTQPHVVEARVEATRRGYALSLSRMPPGGGEIERRRLEASECRILSRAASLIVAVTVSPLRVSAKARRREDEGSTPAAAAVVTAPVSEGRGVGPDASEEGEREEDEREEGERDKGEREEGERDKDERDKDERDKEDERDKDEREREDDAPKKDERARAGWAHRFVAGGLFGASVGVVPAPTLSMGGWAGYAYGPLRLELSGSHALARAEALEPGVEIAFSSSGGGAMVVAASSFGPVLGLLGAGLRAGVIRGGGRGERVIGRTVRDWWLSVPLMAGLAWPAKARIALRGQLELSIAGRRPAIVIGGPEGMVGELRRAPVGFSALVGPQIRLP